MVHPSYSMTTRSLNDNKNTVNMMDGANPTAFVLGFNLLLLSIFITVFSSMANAEDIIEKLTAMINKDETNAQLYIKRADAYFSRTVFLTRSKITPRPSNSIPRRTRPGSAGAWPMPGRVISMRVLKIFQSISNVIQTIRAPTPSAVCVTVETGFRQR